MSDFAAIRATSKTLFQLLTDEITNSSEPSLNGVLIDLRSPKQMADAGNALGISLFLYRVIRDPDLQNRPPVRVSRDQYKPEGIPVHLHYLVTPIRNNREDEHLLLGKVIQVFNDFAVVRGADLQEVLKGSDEELRITMEALSMEDQSQIWFALQAPYRLSVSYEVQVVTIDTNRELVRTEPVLTRETTYSQVLSRS